MVGWWRFGETHVDVVKEQNVYIFLFMGKIPEVYIFFWCWFFIVYTLWDNEFHLFRGRHLFPHLSFILISISYIGSNAVWPMPIVMKSPVYYPISELKIVELSKEIELWSFKNLHVETIVRNMSLKIYNGIRFGQYILNTHRETLTVFANTFMVSDGTFLLIKIRNIT